MKERIRILFLSANPWTTSRILVDEEAREIFERLHEGQYRHVFELYKHEAIRAIDLQRFLMMYEPHIVHFSGHGSKSHRLILGGRPGHGRQVDSRGLVEMLALYKNHLRLVFLNACFTAAQARSLSAVIDYSIGTGQGMRDEAGVTFASAFYRALGFGRSVRRAFDSAKAELGLIKLPLTRGIELFVRDEVRDDDSFPGLRRGVTKRTMRPRSTNRYGVHSQLAPPRPGSTVFKRNQNETDDHRMQTTPSTRRPAEMISRLVTDSKALFPTGTVSLSRVSWSTSCGDGPADHRSPQLTAPAE
jgi:hypothetical protein